MDTLLKKENIRNIQNKINNSTDILEQMENLNKQIAIQKKMIEIKMKY